MKYNTWSGQSGRTETTDHAEEQYAERFDCDVPLINAWLDGVQVEAPHKHYDEARLYPPADLLMTAKGGAITTVMYASQTPIRAPGKVWCLDCDYPFEQTLTTKVCPWCESPAVGLTVGGVKVTIKGGN